MTDPIGPVAGPSATVLSAPRPSVAASPAESAPRAPTPLSVDVVRSDAGVFIYTLRDPATDTVLAVIPRETILSGRNLDERV